MHGGHSREVPVAKSDPRRATIVGIVGVVVGAVMVFAVLFAGNLGGGDEIKTSGATFEVGPAERLAESVARDETPLLFQDPVKFSRPIFVHHLSDDPEKDWVAFDAANGSCVLTWHRETQDFTDCNGTRIDADGGDQHHYPTEVKNGTVVVDLSVDPSTTTTAN